MATIATASMSLRPVSQAIERPGAAPRARGACSTSSSTLRLCVRSSPISIGRSSRPASSASELSFGEARARFVDQPHGGPTSLGMRFDEGSYSVAYAIDFSDLTDDMAALYRRRRRVDRRLPDAHAAPDACPSRRRARLGAGLARRPALSRPYGQRPGLSRRSSPSCPIGRRRPMTGSRSLMMTNDLMLGGVYHPDGDDARARLADVAARAGREAGEDGAGLDRDLRRRLRPLHVPRQSSAMSPSGSRPKRSARRSARARKSASRWLSTAISGSTPGSTARTSSSWSTAARR